MESALKTPIAVMSFKRPALLERVLRSILDQDGDALSDREIHLFQDGAVNAYSRIRYATDDAIAESMATFQRLVPQGVVHASPLNVGVCENFMRAEDYFFQERNFDCAYFFEDDLVLSPLYLQVMNSMEAFARRSGRIAYFAAYGDYYMPAEDVALRRRELTSLDHHWGFGLMREPWRRIREALGDYYALVAGADYGRRYHREILEGYRKYHASPRASSQDAAKAFACDRLGFWRVNTAASFAKYEGVSGEHMNPEMFAALGYSKAVVQYEAVNLRFPIDREIDEALSEQHRLFCSIYETELDNIIAALPGRKLNPTRLCTPEDVQVIYNVLLHREPDRGALKDGHVNRTPVCDLVYGIMSSDEFKGLKEGLTR